MLKLILCDYSDAYILVKKTIIVVGVGADDADIVVDRSNNKAIFKKCALFTDCMSKMNNTQVDNDAIMPMRNLIEYSDNYSETSGSVQQNAKIAVALKYLSNFWRSLEIPLINCEVNLILTCSGSCVISEGNRVTTFAITDTKLYVPVVNLSTLDNKKLLQQFKLGFKRTINWYIHRK